MISNLRVSPRCEHGEYHSGAFESDLAGSVSVGFDFGLSVLESASVVHYSGLVVFCFRPAVLESVSVGLDSGLAVFDSASAAHYSGLAVFERVFEDAESDFVEPQLQLSGDGCPAGMGSETPPATP